MRTLLRASLTGAFCLVFALVIERVSDLLSLVPVILLSFTSGFLGSLFASFMLRRSES